MDAVKRDMRSYEEDDGYGRESMRKDFVPENKNTWDHVSERVRV